MEHLNHFHKSRIRSLLILILISVSFSKADVLSVFDPIFSQDEKQRIAFQGFIANDPVSLKTFFNNWKGADFHPAKGTNLATESSRLDIGTRFNDDYYLGYTYRHDVFLQSSQDLTKLIYTTKNKLDLPLNTDFDIYLDIHGIEAHGAVIARTFQFENSFSISLAASLLYANNMQKGTIYGDAATINEKDYNFQLEANYNYTYNYLYDLDVEQTYGIGFSTHIALSYKYENLSFILNANDLFGKIYWDNLPSSYVSMSSDNKIYDGNGYVKYNPTISGVEKNKKYVQDLPTKVHFETTYAMNENYKATLGIQHMYETMFPFSKITYNSSEKEEYFIAYESKFHTLTLGTRYNSFFIAVSSDKLAEPSALGVQLYLQANF